MKEVRYNDIHVRHEVQSDRYGRLNHVSNKLAQKINISFPSCFDAKITLMLEASNFFQHTK